MDKHDEQILRHISGYIGQIEEANKMFNADIDALKNNSVYRNSAAMCILQIGELAGNLSEKFREETSDEMPWRSIRGLRNIVAHHYGGIDYTSLWETISEDIPRLRAFCEKYINL